MKDAILVAEGDAAQELPHERLDGGEVERAAVAVRVHVLLQVLVAELRVDRKGKEGEAGEFVKAETREGKSDGSHLEDKDELRLGVNHVSQTDDVGMLEL